MSEGVVGLVSIGAVMNTLFYIFLFSYYFHYTKH